MTKLLELAIARLKSLRASEQDAIAQRAVGDRSRQYPPYQLG